MNSAAIKWTKTAGGYEDKANGIVLVKRGREWFVTKGTQSVSIGKRASFDHADAAAARLLGLA